MSHEAEIGFGYEDIQMGNEQSTFLSETGWEMNKIENGLFAPHRSYNGLVLNN